MGDPWAAALDVMFVGPGSLSARYIPKTGDPVPIRVIERQRMGTEGTVRPRPVSLGKIFDIRVSEIAEVHVGSALLVSGALHSIDIPPEIDPEGVTWICDIPEMDRTIEVLRPARIPDSHGDPEDTFTVVMTLAAARLDHSGTELDGALTDQLTAWQQATFLMPWTAAAAAITPAYRLREGDHIFDIQTIAEVGTKVALEITGVARVL